MAKKIDLAKTSIAYRVKRMIDKGIITNFYTIINPLKLGYTPVRFYLRFQYTTTALQAEIIKHFADDNRSWWVASLEGKYHLAVNMLLKNNNEFLDFWKSTLNKYRYYIQDEIFSIYFEFTALNYEYLNQEKNQQKRKKIIIHYDDNRITITEKERAFLKKIAQNARIPSIELAKHLNISPSRIHYLYRELEKKEIILGYRVNINIKKIGYKDFKVDIYLKDYQRRDEIISYLKQNPNLVMLSRSAGISDIEAQFHLPDMETLHTVTQKLYEQFPGTIRSHTYHLVKTQHKWSYIPLI